MPTTTKTRDERTTESIGRVTSRLSRRSFLSKTGGVLAAGFATALFGPLGEPGVAFASTYACSPPCGRYCSGCSAYADCPTGYINCTTSDPFDTAHRCCTYSSGWWYTAGAAGARHKCRDCRVLYCPCCCSSGCCGGFCGCRSTVHY